MTSIDATTERDQLKAILKDDWYSLNSVGDQVSGFSTVSHEYIDSTRWYEIVQVVTRAPSGQHYAWIYEEGSTEHQDSIGPAESGSVDLKPVHAVEETVTVTKWVFDE